MKNIAIVLIGLLMFCFLPSYSAVKNSQVQEISSLDELSALVRTTNKKVIFIDFYQDSCPPCEHFRLLYESWAHLFGKEIVFAKVNTGRLEAKDLYEKYNISRLPTLIVLDSQGKEIDKHAGMDAIRKLNVGNFLAEVRDSHRSTQIRNSNK